MKIEAGKKYRTRDGRVALVAGIDVDASRPSLAILGWIGDEAVGWHIDGAYQADGQHRDDLIAEHREPREWWIVVNDNGVAVNAYSTQTRAAMDYGIERVVRVREVTGDDK